MSRSPSAVLGLGLVLALLLLSAVHLRVGAFDTPWSALPALLWQDDGSAAGFALRDIRLPRLICAMLVGAALAVSGLLIQIVTRNPLGDPGLTGVSGGAAFGVALAITLLSPAVWVVLGSGVAGGALAAVLTFALSHHAGMRSLHLLLAGIAVSAFFIAATGAVIIAQRSSMQTLYFWMIGGFAGKGWPEVALIGPLTASGLAASLALGPILAVLALDDTVARGVGLATGRWRLVSAALSVLLAAGAVAIAGPIAFIGFIAPHLVRHSTPDRAGQLAMRAFLPLTALTGAVLTSGADLATRLIPFGKNAPAGIWVSVFGGILFLLLAQRMLRGPAR
ncbi:MAG: iron ABC transporter permease [Pseudomonadota bacterium]